MPPESKFLDRLLERVDAVFKSLANLIRESKYPGAWKAICILFAAAVFLLSAWAGVQQDVGFRELSVGSGIMVLAMYSMITAWLYVDRRLER